MHDDTLKNPVDAVETEQLPQGEAPSIPDYPSPTSDTPVSAYSLPAQPLAAPSRGINFGLLAWSFILIMVGCLLLSIPFVDELDPLVVAIALFGVTGSSLLVIAVAAALRDYRQNRVS